MLISSDANVSAGARLAYKFAVHAQQPASANYVYVDAQSGEVFRKVSAIRDSNVPGTAATRYSGNQAITIDQVGSTSYRLREAVRGNGAACGSGSASIETYAGGVGNDVTNSSPNWSSETALDAHWAAEKTYDYFRTKFCRNSYDNLGGTFTVVTHAGPLDNSFWTSTNKVVTLYDGKDRCNPWTSLDIVGHEFGHGYTQFLVNSDFSLTEPSAINEGLSDIWGACVENFAAPNKQTWLFGEDIMKSGYLCLRNLANPMVGFDPYFASLNGGPGGYPDVYQGAYYDSKADPHFNATVIGHCFFILANGSTGTNRLVRS